MSTSLLYHAFGIRGYVYKSTEYVSGQVVFRIERAREDLRCPVCGRENVACRGQVLRAFRTLPIGSKPVTILLPVQRVKCPVCGGPGKIGSTLPIRSGTIHTRLNATRSSCRLIRRSRLP